MRGWSKSAKRWTARLEEVSRNYFASCWPSRDVYYFGEDVDIYKNGKVVSHESAWLAGQHGALPGIAMPEDGFIPGSRYYQEIAPGVALDRAEHKRVGFSTQVPAGTFRRLPGGRGDHAARAG